VQLLVTPHYATGKATIFAVYDVARPEFLSIQQSGPDLLVARERTNPHDLVRPAKLYVDDVFHQRVPVLLTIASEGHGINVLLNQKVIIHSNRVSLSCDDLQGTVVLGTSPVDDASWEGQLRQVAISRTSISGERVLAVPDGSTSGTEQALAIYNFREGSGNVVRSSVPGGPVLNIPSRYTILNKTVLTPPSLDNSEDILVNIFGFVPFGLLVMSFLGDTAGPGSAAGCTFLLGAAVSLAIELAQVHLSVRSSDLTDVITNCLGTLIGLGLCSLRPVANCLNAVAVRIETLVTRTGEVSRVSG